MYVSPAFQAKDAGSIPAARSMISPCFIGEMRPAQSGGAERIRDKAGQFGTGRDGESRTESRKVPAAYKETRK